MQRKFYIYCPTCNGTRTPIVPAQPCPQCLGKGMIECEQKNILDFADVKIESDPDNDTFSAAVKLDRPLSVGGGSGKKKEHTLNFEMGNLLRQFKEFPLVCLYPNGEKWFWECLTSEAAVKHEDLITCLELLLAEINKKNKQ